MRDYFEEMNIDYNELKRYEDIETYYDEIQDYTKLIKELQCDRVEALKQIVNKNKENKRLHSIIKEAREYIDKWKFEAGGNGACMNYDDIVDILEILDKEKDNESNRFIK